MRIFYLGTHVDVDLVPCEKGDPCAYDHTCRIHRLFYFLQEAGLVTRRSSVDVPSAEMYAEAARQANEPTAIRVWAGTRERGWSSVGWIRQHAHVEIEKGKLFVNDVELAGWSGAFWYLSDAAELKSARDEPFADAFADAACRWCAEGNPRVQSSVSGVFVHTDTPVGRVLCDAAGRAFPDRRLLQKLDEVVCTECLHHGADPGRAHSNPKCKYAGVPNALPVGFPRECEFGRID